LEIRRRSATYVDTILKGASPADLPGEQPTRFEPVINGKASRQSWPSEAESVGVVAGLAK